MSYKQANVSKKCKETYKKRKTSPRRMNAIYGEEEIQRNGGSAMGPFTGGRSEPEVLEAVPVVNQSGKHIGNALYIPFTDKIIPIKIRMSRDGYYEPFYRRYDEKYNYGRIDENDLGIRIEFFD